MGGVKYILKGYVQLIDEKWLVEYISGSERRQAILKGPDT